MKFLLIGFCCLFSFGLFSQDYYSNAVDVFDHSQDQGEDIIILEDRTFILNSLACMNRPCGSLIEIDEDGQMIWAKAIPWMKVGFRSLGVKDDTLVVSGFDLNDPKEMLIYKSSLDGDSLGITRLGGMENQSFWVSGSIVYENNVVVLGSAPRSDTTYRPGVMYWNGDNGTDSLVLVHAGERDNEVYDARIDENGLLTITVGSITNNENGNPRLLISIYKYNAAKELVWEWEHLYTGSGNIHFVPFLTILRNNTMVFKSESLDINSEEEFWAVDSNGTVIWKYEVEYVSSTTTHTISRLSSTADGGLIAAGRFVDVESDIGFRGYLLKLDSLGNREWDHVYYDEQPEFAERFFSYGFVDAVELVNGDILATGDIDRYYINEQQDTIYDRDTWIVRTDANGCVLEEYCERHVDLATSSQEPVISNLSIEIFPNPVKDQLFIEGLEEIALFNSKLRLTVYDVHGRLRIWEEGIPGSLNVTSLSPGIYFLQIQDGTGGINTQRFLVE